MLDTRRTFIKNATIVSLGFSFLARCANEPKVPFSPSLEMVSDPNGYLDLPEGFSYKVISKQGNPMKDGFLTPGRPDGMGAFASSNGKVILIRNHENSPLPLQNSPFGPENSSLKQLASTQLYDAGQMQRPGLGGTTTLIYNETTQIVEEEFLSLVGTYRNCAGGMTPWGSWLTCEEDVTRIGDFAEKDHGFVFEVPANAKGLVEPKPILEMGRFNHEAVAVDPLTGIVYQTEDRQDGLIYRFLPKEKGNLQAGGQLQVLAIVDQDQLDTRNWSQASVKLNEALPVHWINIENVLSPSDDLRYRGFATGAARFARGEGMWYGDGEFYFACTNGGPQKFGQVFRYQPSPFEGSDQESTQPATLSLFAQSEDKSVLHMCDNLVVAPWGDVLLCEDNGTENFIRRINQAGELSDFACNRSSTSEFAGAVFSPSGKTLFINIQENGETLAITGPWENFLI